MSITSSPFYVAAQEQDPFEDHKTVDKRQSMYKYFVFHAYLPSLNLSRSCEIDSIKDSDLHIDGVGAVSKHTKKTVRFSNRSYVSSRCMNLVKCSCLKHT